MTLQRKGKEGWGGVRKTVKNTKQKKKKTKTKISKITGETNNGS